MKGGPIVRHLFWDVPLFWYGQRIDGIRSPRTIHTPRKDPMRGGFPKHPTPKVWKIGNQSQPTPLIQPLIAEAFGTASIRGAPDESRMIRPDKLPRR